MKIYKEIFYIIHITKEMEKMRFKVYPEFFEEEKIIMKSNYKEPMRAP